jgi:lipopolysaccharide export system protein LptC
MWSGAVRILKIGLPLVALGLILLIFVAPRDQLSFSFSDMEFDLREGLRLEGPRFSGADSAGRPFTIDAEWALPDGPNPETVALGPVRGEALLQDGRRLTLTAGAGAIRPKAREVRLEDGVTVRTEDGWRAEAPSATADLDAETLTVPGPVSGAGPSGEIEAGSMRAARRADGDYIWFEDGVRLRIDPAVARNAE